MDESMKREIRELHAGICSALADPKRIMILYTLSEGPHNVTHLAQALGAPQPTISRHLKVLRERGLVLAHREATNVFYELSDPRLIEAVDMLRAVLRGVYTRRANILHAETQ